jgi:hypothetical protein
LEKFKELFENRIETASKKIEDKIEKKLELEYEKQKKDLEFTDANTNIEAKRKNFIYDIKSIAHLNK